jgi:2'-5' RNA ligase
MDNSPRKFLIAYLLKGKAKEYHENLVSEISQRFGISKITGHIPAHVTLKHFGNRLDNNQVKEVDNLLEKFCRTNKKSIIKLNGIGHFDNHMVFIDVMPSKEINSLYQGLVRKLDKLGWVTYSEYERETVHFHSTLAENFAENKFDEIFDYIKKENPCLEIELDNISLLTRPEDKWMVYKEFFLE